MPIYEYNCLDCGHEFDLLQKFSDPPADTCPSCSGTVRKLISRSAFHLKGDGWYVTDYARKSGKNGSSGSSAKDSGTSKSSDTTADTSTSSKDSATADTSTKDSAKAVGASTAAA